MSGVSQQMMTAAEFLEWTNRDENQGRFFELERGEVVEMPPPGKYHGFVCLNVGSILRSYAAEQGRGYACGNDSGVLVERDPDTVRGPDVSFYEDAQTPADMDRGYSEAPPRLAVEVVSPNDRVNQVMQRVADLLRAGGKVVWVIDPEARDVSVCRAGVEPRLFSAEDTLTNEDVLPGFSCRVAELFALPGQGTS